MSTPRQPTDKAFYAAPGADDVYLRPRCGHGYAPRELAFAATPDGGWLAWVHRRHGREFLGAKRVTASTRGRGRFVGVGLDAARFSKPAFICRGSEPAELVCAADAGPGMRIHTFAYVRGRWAPGSQLPTACSAIYHVDALAAESGADYLVYAGVVPGTAGICAFLRTRQQGTWGPELPLAGQGVSINRPKLAASGAGDVVVAADAYERGRYSVCWQSVAEDGSAAGWARVSSGPGWDLFPSVARDAVGQLWVSWLREAPVRRGDVMGLRHEARVARFTAGAWEAVDADDGQTPADLNLGLLPIARYFGYDGLRRYPRLLAPTDGSVWLVWEQQKDEEEIWDNVGNGYFCGRRHDRNGWRDPVVLVRNGSCFACDPREPHDPERVPVVVKVGHTRSGNDFAVARVDLAGCEPYSARPAALWSGWEPQALPRRQDAVAPRRVVSIEEQDHALFWGDLHCHSAFSPDAEGEPDELYFFARDLAGIDIVCIADNDFYPSKMLLDSETHYTGELARELTCPGEFLALSGYEWTFHRPDAKRSFNHRIVVFPESEQRIARRNEPAGRSQKALRSYLAETGYFNFPHHAYWKLFGAPGEACVEVTAAWGTYILDADTVCNALNDGSRFGFLGNSDSHRFMPGVSGALTGVYASELTRDSVLDALRARRCFATTGNRTGVGFWVNDSFMGASARIPSPPRLRWTVTPEGTLETVTIIRDGDPVHVSSECADEWEDAQAGAGKHWYILQAKEAGDQERHPHNVAPAWGKYAWTSPVWVTVG